MHAFLHAVSSNSVLVVGLAAIVWLLGRVLKNPATLHFLWVLVLVKFVTPAMIVLPLSWTNGMLERTAAMVVATAPPERSAAHRDSASTTDTGAREVTSQAAPAPAGRMTRSVVASRQFVWPLVLATIWCAGAMMLAVVRGFHAIRFARLLRSAADAGPDVLALAQRAATRMGLHRMPPIRVLSLRISPFVWPLGRRASLVLPAGLFERLNADAQQAILLHEMAHLRRKDHYVRLLEWGITTVFWWHPVAWYAGRQLRNLEEQCCDALVLDRLRCLPRTYALALMETLDFLSTNRIRMPLGAAAVQPAADLTRRIEMLKSPPRQSLLTRRQMALVLALAMFPLAVAVSADASPPDEQAGKQAKQAAVKQPAAPPREPAEGVFTKPVAGKNWVAVPITTELQRNFAEGYADAKVFVVINGAPLFNEDDTQLNAGAVDLRGLGDLLESLLVGGMRGTVVLRVDATRLSNPKDLDPSASTLFFEYLHQFGRRWNHNAIVEMTFHGDPEDALDFETFVKMVTVPAHGIKEPGIGNDFAKVYPVRTPLSRYLSGMDADNTNCILHLILSEYDIPLSTVADLKTSVDRLGLKEKNSVRFLIGSRVEQALPPGVPGLGQTYSWRELAKQLGFKRSDGLTLWLD